MNSHSRLWSGSAGGVIALLQPFLATHGGQCKHSHIRPQVRHVSINELTTDSLFHHGKQFVHRLALTSLSFSLYSALPRHGIHQTEGRSFVFFSSNTATRFTRMGGHLLADIWEPLQSLDFDRSRAMVDAYRREHMRPPPR